MSDQRDDDVTATFDQTNGLADGLTGDSDGTAEGAEHSAADRDSDESRVNDPGPEDSPES